MPNKSWSFRPKVNKNFTQAEKKPVVAVAQDQSQKKVTKKQPSKPQTKKRPVRRKGLSFNETKNLEQLYLKGPASYGSKLPLGKVQPYSETKPSFTKYRSIRLKFPSFSERY